MRARLFVCLFVFGQKSCAGGAGRGRWAWARSASPLATALQQNSSKMAQNVRMKISVVSVVLQRENN